jgi:hypothetical protein
MKLPLQILYWLCLSRDNLNNILMSNASQEPSSNVCVCVCVCVHAHLLCVYAHISPSAASEEEVPLAKKPAVCESQYAC